ncbi:hypothetical protein GLYMA_14G019650v4 [Glycine max]|nr:hypothetical protein GLYMA_14G019650v4 [Glycine max]
MAYAFSHQFYQQEASKFKRQIRDIQNLNRHILGEALSSLSLKELKNLESRLEKGLSRVRSRKHETLFADIEFMQKRVLIISFDAISFCLIYLLHTHTYIYIVSKENISKFYDIETKYIFSIIMDLSVLTVKHILLRLINCFLFKDQ